MTALERYHVEIRSSYDGIDLDAVDRAILDLPEPWQVIPHLTPVLEPGGVLVAYTPSIIQATRVREALDAGPYAMIATTEVLNRGLAHRRPCRTAGPSHGGPHGLPHLGAPGRVGGRLKRSAPAGFGAPVNRVAAAGPGTPWS